MCLCVGQRAHTDINTLCLSNVFISKASSDFAQAWCLRACLLSSVAQNRCGPELFGIQAFFAAMHAWCALADGRDEEESEKGMGAWADLAQEGASDTSGYEDGEEDAPMDVSEVCAGMWGGAPFQT